MALPPPKIGRQPGVFRGPPRWNEYIPKKNRHSESVHCALQVLPEGGAMRAGGSRSKLGDDFLTPGIFFPSILKNVRPGDYR